MYLIRLWTLDPLMNPNFMPLGVHVHVSVQPIVQRKFVLTVRRNKTCTVHTGNEAYELLTTGMIEGPSIVFCRYAEAGVSKIRSHWYQDAKVCEAIHGYDANSLYLFCSGQEMPCRKEKLHRSKNPENPKVIKNITEESISIFGASFSHLCLLASSAPHLANTKNKLFVFSTPLWLSPVSAMTPNMYPRFLSWEHSYRKRQTSSRPRWQEAFL